KETFDNSMSFGESVGKKILERTTVDQYKETRGMPKFLGSHDIGKWRPTAPDYLDGSEPFWFMMKTLVLYSADQVMCRAPPSFSMNEHSAFYKSVNEVYDITTHLTDEQKT